MNPIFSVSTDLLCVNTLRILSADMVEKANSGHPGAPMGMAPMAYVLWTRFLKVNPSDPAWINRDRFVLSAGHASALLYSLLHLSGYGLTLEDLKSFRQWESRTPGHPEYRMTPGVETTTGPLGQGFTNAVGMALAEKILSNHFNRPGFEVLKHFTFAIASDGDLMEGISYEAAALAGHWKLGRLICLYDDNRITIDGSTDLSTSENVSARFEAAGWQVLEVASGDSDLAAIERALQAARAEENRPTLIRVRTTIGFGAPTKGNSCHSHGAPLGAEELRKAKRELGFAEDTCFAVPQEAAAEFHKIAERGQAEQKLWNETLKRYRAAHPDAAADWDPFFARAFGKNPETILPVEEKGEAQATRAASGKNLNLAASRIKNLFSGSADLSDSVNTTLKGLGAFTPAEPRGRNIHYGVREHAMASIMNGLLLHGGIVPAVGTFLIFSDYMKPAVRLAALMGLPAWYLFSHDSVGLGEDGPTHQPIEQLAGLRAIPNLAVIRPADVYETNAAWRVMIGRTQGPTALILTRHKVPALEGARLHAGEGVGKGGYILKKESGSGAPELILIATGSETALAYLAAELLEKEGRRVRVVSMPCHHLFDAQSPAYRESVLPSSVECRLAVEAASTLGWHRYTGLKGKVIGIDRFGASAPAEKLFVAFGFTPENIAVEARKLIASPPGKKD